MPLVRFHEYTQGVQTHIAAWPMTFEFGRLEAPTPGHEDFNGDLHASQFMAREGRCFVVVATQVLSEEGFEKCNIKEGKEVVRKAVIRLPLTCGNDWIPSPQNGGGHSMIYAPSGKPLVQPLAADKEGILQADVNLADIDGATQMIDNVGHTARPDLLSLLVREVPATVVTRMKE
jgi:nitrilase